MPLGARDLLILIGQSKSKEGRGWSSFERECELGKGSDSKSQLCYSQPISSSINSWHLALICSLILNDRRIRRLVWRGLVANMESCDYWILSLCDVRSGSGDMQLPWSQQDYQSSSGTSSVVADRSLTCIHLLVTPWTAAHQASLSFTISWSLL